MPISIVTDEHSTITSYPLVEVEIKDSLNDDDWQNTTHVFCDKLTLAVNGYDEAELTRYLGDVIQPGTDYFAEYPPSGTVGKFIRITFTSEDDPDSFYWIGYIVSHSKRRSAVKGAAPGDNRLTGKEQVFRVVGLEWFLDRVQIDSSVVYETNHIYRALAFNGGRGAGYDADSRTRANRSASVNDAGVYTFVPANESGELWTIGNIVKYLLEYFAPKNKTGDAAPVRYFLSPSDESAHVLDGIAPTINPENMTVFEVLNSLLSPQRGFVWWAEAKEAPFGATEVHIRVETLTTSNITLPSLGTIPANRDQQSLDFDKQRTVGDVSIAEAGRRIYHQIVVRGARMTSTATFGMREIDGGVFELIDDWILAFEEAYLAAAFATTGYGDLSDKDKGARNDAFRRAEQFAQVFSYVRLDPNFWDGKSGDGHSATRNWTFPVLTENGSISGGLPFNVNGLRFLNSTRLKQGWNYQNVEAITPSTQDWSEGEYMPTFAIINVAAGDHDKYQFVEKMSQHNFAEGELVSEKISVSYSLSTQSVSPGIILKANGSQHACALNHWVGAEPTRTEPQVDIDTMRVTTTLEADTYCEAKWPADDALPADIPLQKLMISAGNEYRLDFLAANTVIDLNNGEPVLTTGGRLRDDRARLRDIARVAYEWYRVDRRPMRVTFRNIRNLWRLGMMITAIGEGTTREDINTVVSTIGFDFKNGQTNIETHDAGLDLARVV